MTTALTAYIIQGLFTLWALCWLAASFAAKKRRFREPLATRWRYQAVVAAGLLHMLVGLPDFAHADTDFAARTTGFDLVCIETVAAGIAWMLWARWHLGRNWSGTVQLKEDHKLIRTGPYALTRHPIYSGLLLAFLGLAVFLDRWLEVPGYALLMIGFRMKLRREERIMEQAFGEEYSRYHAEVPALVPRLDASCRSDHEA